MKLKEYVPVCAAKFARFTRPEVHDYINFVRLHCQYNSLENYVLWRMFHVINCVDNLHYLTKFMQNILI